MDKLKGVVKNYGAVVVVAAIMSYLSSRYIFVGSAMSLLPWGVIAVAWGVSSTDKHIALRRGAVYGFFQSFIFLWIDKRGALSVGQFLALCAIITALGLLAAGAAWVAALLGWKIKGLVTRK